jgi:uncharacterized protein
LFHPLKVAIAASSVLSRKSPPDFDTIERMAVSVSSSTSKFTRRQFVKTALVGAAGLAIYAGEVERHFLEVTRSQVRIPGLHAAFDGLRIAQLSDIHLDAFTEPFFLRHAVSRINQLNPDMVFLTGDYVTSGRLFRRFNHHAAEQCGAILRQLACPHRYAILGNHDVSAGAEMVTAALVEHGIPVLRNSYMPIEHGGGRFWLAGLDDAVTGKPDPERTIPPSIRNIAQEPVILMCHAPDYVDRLLDNPVGGAISLVLSGHTHGGQVRLPLVGALKLPPLGQKYVEGWFRLKNLQLHVNRGLGTVGVPFRFDCPPEISVITLRAV